MVTGFLATPLGNRFETNPSLILRIIPRWNFFAPRPGTVDYHLLYRDVLEGGTVGPWRECKDFESTRTIASAIWHPGKRAKKTLSDVAVGFILLGNQAPEVVKLSMPHLLLLSYVTALPRSPLSTAVQYVIIETSAAEPKPNVLFLSGMHSL